MRVTHACLGRAVAVYLLPATQCCTFGGRQVIRSYTKFLVCQRLHPCDSTVLASGCGVSGKGVTTQLHSSGLRVWSIGCRDAILETKRVDRAGMQLHGSGLRVWSIGHSGSSRSSTVLAFGCGVSGVSTVIRFWPAPSCPQDPHAWTPPGEGVHAAKNQDQVGLLCIRLRIHLRVRMSTPAHLAWKEYGVNRRVQSADLSHSKPLMVPAGPLSSSGSPCLDTSG